jgi:hypothetical protein
MASQDWLRVALPTALIAADVLFAGTMLISCRTPPPREEPFERMPLRGECEINRIVGCGAGHLPRISESDWSDAQIASLLRLSDRGVNLAVDRSGPSTVLVSDCELDGGYVEIAGGPGRFWGTDRAFYYSEEIPSACRTATHLIASFAVAEDGKGGRRRFSAILVPLPCPPSTDMNPAVGCIGKGLTGPKRQARSLMMAGFETRRAKERDFEKRPTDVGQLFETYALYPDDPWGALYLAGYSRYPPESKDRGLASVLWWPGGKYNFRMNGQNTVLEPNYQWEATPHRLSCPETYSCQGEPPVFLACFGGLFRPAPDYDGCWTPVRPFMPRSADAGAR